MEAFSRSPSEAAIDRPTIARTRLVLVDDHELFRAGLRAMLESAPDFDVVGEAADAHAAYALVDALKPEVAVVDVRLNGTDGIAATRELKRRAPRLHVAMLSATSEPDYVAEALSAGALGYLIKGDSFEGFLLGIRAIAHGERFITPALSAAAIDQYRGIAKLNGRTQVFDGLSKREREVFRMLIHGAHNQEVAKQLFISVKTVETHRAHILRKLGCHSIVDLMRFAARHALVD